MAVLKPSGSMAYAKDVRYLADAARMELADAVDSLPWDAELATLEANRDYVIAKLWQISNKYGDAAATCAADFFDDATDAIGTKAGKAAKAVMADEAAIGQIDASVRYAAGSLFNEDGVPDVDAFVSRCDNVVTRNVMTMANETLANSGEKSRLKVMYARVLDESEHTCPLCEELSDLGYVWYDSDMIQLHDGCKCTVVPGFVVS